MLKLMKYEFKKQMFSKLIILIGIILTEVYFAVSIFREKEQEIASSMGIFTILAVISIFYVGVESVTVFNRDLKTKQSYMLYMVPYSTYSIIGAKMIAAFLQILFTGLLFLGGIVIDFLIVFAKFGDLKRIFEILKQFFEEIFRIQLDIPLFLSVSTFVFFLWMMVVLCGMFAISLSTTFLANNRFRTPVSAVIFVILFRVIGWLSNQLIPDSITEAWNQILIQGLYLGVASVILYFGTAWMLDKKVSV